MRTIRGRLTLAFAFVIGAALVLFAAIALSANRRSTERRMQARVFNSADLASRVIEQGGTGVFGSVIVSEGETANQPVLSQGIRRLLGVLPGYVIVSDSARVLYESPAVERLRDRDRSRLTRAIFQAFSPDSAAAYITMDSTRLFVRMQFERSDTRAPSLRVLAAENAEGLQLHRLELFTPVLVVLPLIFLLSVIVAWGLAGAKLEPVDRLIDDLEAIQDGRSLHRRLPVESDENELDRIAEKINAMIARLEGSFAGLRRFTADASHELKTPLTVLRADIERAMSSPNVAADQLPALEEALAETARMADLVDSLLTLARADEGRFDIHRELVDLDAMVRDVADTASMLGEAAGVTVTLGEVAPLVMQGDPVRLRQLFLNIITNAVKYTSRTGSVAISLEQRGAEAAFIVQDTGLGIAAADLPFIFERFWRADRARSRGGERGGFGLGLAIAQWIAHAHRGAINVASRLGRGTTFTVTLPSRRQE